MKKTLRVIPMLMCILLFTSIAQASNEVLYFPSWQVEEPGFKQWWGELVDEFESQNPGVRVEVESISPISTLLRKQMTSCAAGNPPEILHLAARNVFPFVEQGLLVPLDDKLRETDIEKAWPEVNNWYDCEGETYGVLLLATPYLLYYNEALFEKEGLEVPSNWDDFIVAAKQLTKDIDGDGRIDQYGYIMPTNEDTPLTMYSTFFLINKGLHWGNETELTVNTAANAEALEPLRGLARVNAMPENTEINDARQMFYEGKAAMIIDGTWFKTACEEACIEEVKPHIKRTTSIFDIPPIGVSNGLHIPKGLTKEKEELVWKFICLATRPEWQVKYARLTGNPPSRIDIWNDDFKREMPELADFVDAVDRGVNYVPPNLSIRVDYNKFALVCSEYLTEVLWGNRPISQILNDMEKALKWELNL
jgi:multiple sugar transport system substrate-binding protein